MIWIAHGECTKRKSFNVHSIKAYGRVELELQSFLTSAQIDEVVCLTPWPPYLGRQSSITE
jgi:hypothetical protein